jgi:hypothetical protein
MITESYEEWNILIQKLKERNSKLYDTGNLSENCNQENQPARQKIIQRRVHDDPNV